MCIVTQLVILRRRVSSGGLRFPDTERRLDLTFSVVSMIPEIPLATPEIFYSEGRWLPAVLNTQPHDLMLNITRPRKSPPESPPPASRPAPQPGEECPQEPSLSSASCLAGWRRHNRLIDCMWLLVAISPTCPQVQC